MSDSSTALITDTRALRNTLGRFATGVTIITTRDADGAPVGVTVNSFSSVSLDPPLVLWSLARSAMSLPAFRSHGWWAVHVLSAEQEALSSRFAGRGTDKFDRLPYGHGIGEVPLLDGCAARLQCRTERLYDGGDHIILIGEVLAFEQGEATPLLFHGGRYARLAA